MHSEISQGDWLLYKCGRDEIRYALVVRVYEKSIDAAFIDGDERY